MAGAYLLTARLSQAVFYYGLRSCVTIEEFVTHSPQLIFTGSGYQEVVNGRLNVFTGS